MATAHLWFDPICPWSWLTSRWLLEVETVRDVTARFHVMSLAVLNEDKPPRADGYDEALRESWGPLRVLTAADLSFGPDAVRHLYSSIGGLIHQERTPINRDLYAYALARADLPHSLANAATDSFYDHSVRESHAQAATQTGTDCGTPVLQLGRPDGGTAAFFGPVVTPYPRGEAAGRLWDAVALAAATDGFFELKRTRTIGPDLT
ncbi:MAG: disulfide bond formation protein DsbA [Micromonosporaceae bacterium]